MVRFLFPHARLETRSSFGLGINRTAWKVRSMTLHERINQSQLGQVEDGRLVGSRLMNTSTR